MARKGTAWPTTATSAIRSAATARAKTAATTTREADGHGYILDAEAEGWSNAADLCFLLSCLTPKTLSKKIFSPLEGILALTVQKTLPEVKKLQLFGNL